MKQKIISIIKYNKVVYRVYYCIASLFVRVLKMFVKPDENLILFNSFAGRKFDDSPRAIFEVMRKDPRFREYKFVWAFHQPDKFSVEGAEKIKTDGLCYFITALKARAWITNSSVERGLGFKGKKTFYLNTWHGSPIKKMGSDIAKDNQSFTGGTKKTVDIMNTQSYFEADIFSKCFEIPRERFIEVGLPRNDELANYSERERIELRRRLGIPQDKVVLLYCPTFREYEKDSNLGVVLAPPMNLNKWEYELGDRFILLFRAHYEVSKVMNVEENEFVRNVTDYQSLNDLMIVSDILISDYSSVYFDYSIMDKGMIHFTYDYALYEKNRGMYFDVRDYLDGSDNEDDLISLIQNFEYSNEVEKTRLFRRKFVNFYGNASKQTVDCIAAHIM